MLIIFELSPNSELASNASIFIVREETLALPDNLIEQSKMGVVYVDEIHGRPHETLELNFEVGQSGHRGQRSQLLIKPDSDIPIACFGSPTVGSRAEEIGLSDSLRLEFGNQLFHPRILPEVTGAVDDRLEMVPEGRVFGCRVSELFGRRGAEQVECWVASHSCESRELPLDWGAGRWQACRMPGGASLLEVELLFR